MLRAWLLEFKEKRPIYTAILDLLGKLPIQYKNQIERSKIGLTVKLFEANDDPEVVNTCRVVSSFSSSSSWPSWKNQQNLLSSHSSLRSGTTLRKLSQFKRGKQPSSPEPI